MLLARTDAAALSNAPAGLFGADVVCGLPSRESGRRQTLDHAPAANPRPQGLESPIGRPEPAAAGRSARVWAAYAMGRALSA